MAIKRLDNNITTAIQDGWTFLEKQNQTGFFNCWIGKSRELSQKVLSPREIFSTIIIFEALLKHHPMIGLTADALDYLSKQFEQKPLTFFEDRSLYPPDVDVLSLAGSILFESDKISIKDAKKIFKIVTNNADKKGIIQVWVTDDKRPKRRDHVAGANVLYFAYLLNEEERVKKTEEWVLEILGSDFYLKGSRYYNSPDTFLYFLTRAAERFPTLNRKLKKSISEKINERFKATAYPLDIAMRIIISKTLGISSQDDCVQLLKLQRDDGSWPLDALFRFGSRPKYFGSEAIVTAFCIRALELSA